MKWIQKTENDPNISYIYIFCYSIPNWTPLPDSQPKTEEAEESKEKYLKILWKFLILRKVNYSRVSYWINPTGGAYYEKTIGPEAPVFGRATD